MQNTKPSCDISVVIPLYNKASTIYTTLISVLAQSVRPREVIVIDDGSTDGSAEIVERMIVDAPYVKLVRQANAGVSAARNRAIEMAQGEWVALLDGDDIWSPEYLKAVHEMIERWPECGAYGTGFYVEDNMRSIVGSTPKQTGKVDFFTESMHRYVLIPSATTLRRDLVLRLGGFPVGMRMGEDQYLWTKIAREAEVACTYVLLDKENTVHGICAPPPRRLTEPVPAHTFPAAEFSYLSKGEIPLDEELPKEGVKGICVYTVTPV